MLKLLFGEPLKPGSTAPDFTLPDQWGKSHQLSQYRGRWTVLYFYPKDHTFGCTKEACSFRDNNEWFEKNNIALLGVSTDTAASHKSFSESNELNFPILADPTGEVSKSYGVLMAVGIANRTTFVIDPQGRIADSLHWVNWFRYAEKVVERVNELRAAPGAP